MKPPDLFAAIWRLDGQVNLGLKPSGFLGFPVRDFTWTAPDCLQLHFLNFIGVDSPLPHYLLELALHNSAFAELLAIFNEQFYRLLYAIWWAVHPLANQAMYQGLASRFLGFQESSEWVVYADCWLLKPGILGLRKALQRCLGAIPFSVTESVGHWFELEGRQTLPVNLGSVILGLRFFSHQYCMECEVGPLSPLQSIDLDFLKKLIAHFTERVTVRLIVGYADQQLQLGRNALGSIRLFPAVRIFME